jgi:Viral BACON domain/Matrixin
LMRIPGVLALLIGFIAFARPLAASTVIFRTDAELIALSERVVHALVVGQRTTWGGAQGRTIFTVTTLEVLEDLTGQLGDTIEVWELGGAIGNEFMRVGGAVEYQIGDEVLVCLERGPQGLRSVAMNFSKFDVLPTTTGDARLQRRLTDTVIAGAISARERTLGEFRQLVEQVTGQRSRRRATPLAEGPMTAWEPFTKLGGEPGWRWRQADQGLPIRVYRNTLAPAPLLSGDGTSEIQTAAAAWTNPSTASINLQYGGTSAQSHVKGPWSGISGPAVMVSFEDPNNEISDLTLAIGGCAGSLNAGGTIDGTTFHGCTSGFVIFENAANLGTDYRQSLDFTRVLTHEIGHAIGLGHTQFNGSVPSPQSNLMYQSCCTAGTPVPPSLGPDDLAGLNFIYPNIGPSCTFSLIPTSATRPASGGTGLVSVLAPAGCSWNAASNSSFISITSASTGTGNGTVAYSVAANGTTLRSGSLTIAEQTFTLSQAGTGPTMTLDRTSVRFGAVGSGGSFLSRTSPQIVRLAQSGAGTVTWTASSNQPWLQVSPASGTGPANLTLTVTQTGQTPGVYAGAVTLAFSGAGSAPGQIGVTLAIMTPGASANPFGFVDTPTNNATGITGAVPFTGWALDDVEVANVFLCRAAVAGEVAPVDGNCAGAAQFFVGTGLFIDGTRPDVQAAYPAYPRNTTAGWGLMVLTNMLPSQGNGTFVFYVYAVDREGHTVLIGTRTITCDNAHATRPFGTVDTPAQGETVSGAAYVNFGWALTQNPKVIPFDGSTMQVYVDGALVGNPSYNHFRSDIATLFPGLANSNGAVGFRSIDTTTLANGLHTIVWTATDSAGATSGLGSRYFRVSNGTMAVTAAAETSVSSADVAAVAIDPAPILGRRSWDPEAPWFAYSVGASGRAVIRGEEIDRFELWLGELRGHRFSGYLRVGNDLAALPVGSRLNETTGLFMWSPGVGFIGHYDLVFARWAGDRAVARQEVRIIIAPKSSGHVGAQVVIDAPRMQQEVRQPFHLGGWAADLDAEVGTGIDTLHVWAYPVAGGLPIFIGVPTYGGARPDVAAVHGDQFRESGYGLTVQSLPPGSYDLAVFAWSNVTGGFVPAKLVRVTVR